MRYQAVDNGYESTDTKEIFNRTLYGSHEYDDLHERYFVFAGDRPLFMGALTDWSKHTACHYAKSGVLMSGLALTPGMKNPHFYTEDIDTSSRWFHQAEDTKAIFRNGWMEYELSQFSPWFPEVNVEIKAFPLIPENGFLVQYRITTDQRVIFCAGFGGITDFIGRFEYPQAKVRYFNVSDCDGTTVTCGNNRATVKSEYGSCIQIGASFPVKVETGDAAALQNEPPSMFLSALANEKSPVVKMSSVINAGDTFEGFIVVVRSSDESVLDKWLNYDDPIIILKNQIHRKRAGIDIHTPDEEFNQTIPSTILAMDASWHKNSFHHGAHGYHSPFLGWRNWYGPTVVGWHNRVKTTIQAHFAQLVRTADGPEMVWYDGKDRPDLDHEGTQYHQIRNSIGYLPCFLGGNDIYNMQEVALDMVFHHLEQTGDLKFAEVLFDDLATALDWEERILDPDGDGLYQSFLNTWISDGHSYNGGGCTQASSYNYRFNVIMAKIAAKLGRPGEKFQSRANAILKAINEKLWLKDSGIMAEYIDTIGNKLVHPSPELSTLYLAIDCGVVDRFQAYQMLRFTETEIRNERTRNRNGRLVYSSNWLPKKYSTCGLFPAENIHLALVYYQIGLKERGNEILDALTECYFSGSNPGLLSHVLTGSGIEDIGDVDFTDVSSMYLRLVVEGLYGIRFHLIDDYIEISPGFPDTWTHANLKLPDFSMNYYRSGNKESFQFYSDAQGCKIFRIPLRSTQIEAVFLNGESIEYTFEAAVGKCYLVVNTKLSGLLHLQVIHDVAPLPYLEVNPLKLLEGKQVMMEVTGGEILDCRDDADAFCELEFDGNRVYTQAKRSGNHTLYILVKAGQYESWMPADLRVEQKKVIQTPCVQMAKNSFQPLDITSYFNTSLTTLHMQEYRSPRPEGYSIGMRLNGRYAWEWNHCGHNALEVNDSRLRQCGGIFKTQSGINFATPQTGLNLAAVSIWDNFPTTMEIPLPSDTCEIALFFIGVTNCMQSYVENARISIIYKDGGKVSTSLVHPLNFDDWLVPALQTQNETVYFSDYNHGIVQLMRAEPGREPAAICLEANANEVILGLLGVSIRRL